MYTAHMETLQMISFQDDLRFKYSGWYFSKY